MDHVHCHKCTMRFTVAEPPRYDTDRMRCPDCKRPFWCGAAPGTCHPAVSPANASLFSETLPAAHRARVLA